MIVDKEKYITFEEALLCLTDDGILSKIRSSYLDFLVSTFVESAAESSSTSIEDIWRCYVSHEFTYTPTIIYYTHFLIFPLSGMAHFDLNS